MLSLVLQYADQSADDVEAATMINVEVFATESGSDLNWVAQIQFLNERLKYVESRLNL